MNIKLKKVAIISYGNCNNFGDRLGLGLILSLLPVNVEIDFLFLPPFWKKLDKEYDLLIVGTGHSIFFRTLEDPDFINFYEKHNKKIGFFGLQYHELINKNKLKKFISQLDYWFARNIDDLDRYINFNKNVTHTGDILINSIPLTRWKIDKTLNIEKNFINNQSDTYKIIREIQKYKRVSSSRIHPLLTALNSCEEFKFCEQQEMTLENKKLSAKSNKFNNMLYDIFKIKYEENKWYPVDKQKILEYRIFVENNIRKIKNKLINYFII